MNYTSPLPVPVAHRHAGEPLEQSPVGWGQGSYALDTAHDAGLAPTDPNMGLPALRDGRYRFDRRLLNLGDQALLDGATALDLHPAPYLER